MIGHSSAKQADLKNIAGQLDVVKAYRRENDLSPKGGDKTPSIDVTNVDIQKVEKSFYSKNPYGNDPDPDHDAKSTSQMS